jgi:hypothetical protein
MLLDGECAGIAQCAEFMSEIEESIRRTPAIVRT